KTQAVAAAHALDPASFDEKVLKDHAVGEAASIVSAIPDVRAALVAFQREFAAAPPGAVLDGRDIGTVICPDADVKIFVIAAPEVRARRRAAELTAGGQAADEATILEDIRRRDERDRSRAVAPLKPADDAVELDTSDLDVEAALAAAIGIIEGARRSRAGRASIASKACTGSCPACTVSSDGEICTTLVSAFTDGSVT